MIKLYNSLTNKIEEFKSIKENEVSMYVCGPTVYSNIHIGNSRPVVFFDTVARFFKYLGYKVTYVSNFTDIDDKIIKRAIEEGKTESEISEKYISEISETYKMLNCLPHDANPKVTENMDSIIKFIDELVEKKGAYVVDGDVYFDVSKIKEYGTLSGQTVENLIKGARIEQNEKKLNPIDFTLWKETEVGLKWDSPWGKGRPGWHTECVVMINNIFGGPIDIHGGGLDLKFPHHDNEIAQSICHNDHKIANYWMHNGRIDFGGEKMSKSLGNVLWAKDLLKQVPHQVYRLLILNVPYRQPLNYKEDLLKQATNDYEKIKRAYISLFRKLEVEKEDLGKEELTNNELVNLKQEFINAMSNDFNTANAITSIFQLTKMVNNYVRNKETNVSDMKQALGLFDEMLWVLGIGVDIKELSAEELEIVKKWQEARNNKDFAKADEYRKEINERNILL